jgi:hypothetical protein
MEFISCSFTPKNISISSDFDIVQNNEMNIEAVQHEKGIFFSGVYNYANDFN